MERAVRVTVLTLDDAKFFKVMNGFSFRDYHIAEESEDQRKKDRLDMRHNIMADVNPYQIDRQAF